MFLVLEKQRALGSPLILPLHWGPVWFCQKQRKIFFLERQKVSMILELFRWKHAFVSSRCTINRAAWLGHRAIRNVCAWTARLDHDLFLAQVWGLPMKNSCHEFLKQEPVSITQLRSGRCWTWLRRLHQCTCDRGQTFPTFWRFIACLGLKARLPLAKRWKKKQHIFAVKWYITLPFEKEHLLCHKGAQQDERRSSRNAEAGE